MKRKQRPLHAKVRGKRGKPFAKGHAKIGGRQKGTPNKFTRDVKEAVLNALEKLGGEDWLVKLGKYERKAFAMLLGKAMPMTVAGDPKNPLVPREVALSVEFVEPPKEQS